MRSPVGAIFALFSWPTMKKNLTVQYPTHFKSVLYFRYVDDTLTMLDNPDHVSNFLGYLNKQHAKFSFTLEAESNGTLPFFNCVISKPNNRLSTSMYRKPTFTRLLSSHYTNTSRKFKINTFVHRMYHLFSFFFSFEQEINFLRIFFHKQ